MIIMTDPPRPDSAGFNTASTDRVLSSPGRICRGQQKSGLEEDENTGNGEMDKKAGKVRETGTKRALI